MDITELQAMRDQLTSQVDLRATPVDYSDLVKRGILSKAGVWYRVNINPRALPKHIAERICEVANDSKGVKVRFVSESGIQRHLKKMRKAGF